MITHANAIAMLSGLVYLVEKVFVKWVGFILNVKSDNILVVQVVSYLVCYIELTFLLYIVINVVGSKILALECYYVNSRVNKVDDWLTDW